MFLSFYLENFFQNFKLEAVAKPTPETTGRNFISKPVTLNVSLVELVPITTKPSAVIKKLFNRMNFLILICVFCLQIVVEVN